MDMFDVEMSYRLCSHVPVPYFDWGGPGGLAHKLFAPPLPWDQVGEGCSLRGCVCVSQYQINDCRASSSLTPFEPARVTCVPFLSIGSHAHQHHHNVKCEQNLNPHYHVQKTGEVVFVNANCHPPSNRTELVQALMQHVHVDAWGYCLKNVKV